MSDGREHIGKVGALSLSAGFCIILAVLFREYSSKTGWHALFAILGVVFIIWGMFEMFRRK